MLFFIIVIIYTSYNINSINLTDQLFMMIHQLILQCENLEFLEIIEEMFPRYCMHSDIDLSVYYNIE